MSERKSFLIRVDPALLESVQRWAEDELRSRNAHIEFLLRDALRRAGRLPKPSVQGTGSYTSPKATPEEG